MSALAQAIKNTTTGFLESFVKASQVKDTRLLSMYLTEDCERYVGPACFLRLVGAPLDFKMTNAEYEADFGKMEFYVFETHDMHDLTIDTTNLKAAVRSGLIGKFNDGKEIERTFVWFLDFNEDGSKIVKVYQHNDAAEARNHRLTMRAYYEAKEKATN